MSVARVCLHGAESIGKSTLAQRLADHFGTIWVPEYGRAYCEVHGTDCSMEDLLAIGRGQQALAAGAVPNARGGLIFLDTDPVMTAVWADMMLGRRDPWFDRFDDLADLYIVPGIDMPFIDDGLRVYGQDGDRERFQRLSIAELERRGARWTAVDGSPDDRFRQSIAAIEAAGLAT